MRTNNSDLLGGGQRLVGVISQICSGCRHPGCHPLQLNSESSKHQLGKSHPSCPLSHRNPRTTTFNPHRKRRKRPMRSRRRQGLPINYSQGFDLMIHAVLLQRNQKRKRITGPRFAYASLTLLLETYNVYQSLVILKVTAHPETHGIRHQQIWPILFPCTLL